MEAIPLLKNLLPDPALADGIEELIQQAYMSDDYSYAESTNDDLQKFRKKRYHDETHGYELIFEVWRSEWVS